MLAFAAMLAVVVVLALASAWWTARLLPPVGDGRGVAMSAAAILFLYAYAIIVHRLCLTIAPLAEGSIGAGSHAEFCYQVYLLFYLVLFNTLVRGRVIPIPLMRLVYQALGARLGPHTYSAGMIFDPVFVTIGANSLIGEMAMLVPHVIEGSTLGHYRIAIGNNVTVGARAIILSGVSIGDDVIVAANSMVAKGTCIPRGEMWGGTPARRLRAAGTGEKQSASAPRWREGKAAPLVSSGDNSSKRGEHEV